MNSKEIQVKKRNGRLQKLDINKVNICAQRACENLDDVSPSEIVIDANVQLYDKITTKEIDSALIMSARAKIEKEPNYSYVAARLLLGNIHKEVFGSSVDKDAFDHQYRLSFIRNIKLLVKEKILTPKLLDFDLKKLSEALKLERDSKFKYLGLQIIYDRYFHHLNGRRLESPQSFWMRVAMGLALNEKNKEKKCIEFYEAISNFRVCPSTPTLFNSGSVRSQLSSCFLSTYDDSIDGIFEGVSKVAPGEVWIIERDNPLGEPDRRDPTIGRYAAIGEGVAQEDTVLAAAPSIEVLEGWEGCLCGIDDLVDEALVGPVDIVVFAVI